MVRIFAAALIFIASWTSASSGVLVNVIEKSSPPTDFRSAFLSCNFSSKEVQKLLTLHGVKFLRGKVATNKGDPYFGEYELTPPLLVGGAEISYIARNIQDVFDGVVVKLGNVDAKQWVSIGAKDSGLQTELPDDRPWTLFRGGRGTGVFIIPDALGQGSLMCYRMR